MRTSKLYTAAAAVVLLTAGAATTGHATTTVAAQASACQPAWHLMPTPPAPDATVPAGQQSAQYLLSVSPISSRDVKFAGYQFVRGSITAPLTLSWNGQRFTQPASGPSSPFTQPFSWASERRAGSSFDSASDGWQVLDYDLAEGDWDVSLAEHWHDGRWIMTPMALAPDPATEGMQMRAVAALSPTDAWVVGGLYRSAPHVLFGTQPVGAMIEHWDGTQWKSVPNPAIAQAGASLYGLSARSPDDIWVVGELDNAAGPTPFTEHWDGASWQIIPAPAPSQSATLFNVSADGPDDVWAVGGTETQEGILWFLTPLVEHWDGKAWSIVPLPNSVAQYDQDKGSPVVYAESPTDVWITSPGVENGSAFLHWNGTTMSTVPVPGPKLAGLSYAYNAIAGFGPDDVWAAGQVTASFRHIITPVIAHFSCG